MNNGKNQRTSNLSRIRTVREQGLDGRKKSDRRKRAFQPMLDGVLEKRQLLTVTADIDPVTAVLSITSDAQENINIFTNGSYTTVNGSPLVHGSSSYNTIVIDTTVTSLSRTINFAAPTNTPFTGNGFALSNITLTGLAANTSRINSITNAFTFTANPTVSVNASDVGISGSALISQAQLFAANTANINISPGTYYDNVDIVKNLNLSVSGFTTGTVNLVTTPGASALKVNSGSLTITTPTGSIPTPYTTYFVIDSSGAGSTGIELNNSSTSYTDNPSTLLSFGSNLAYSFKNSAGTLTVNSNHTNSNILTAGGNTSISSGVVNTGNVFLTSGNFTNNGTVQGNYTQSNGTGINYGNITGVVSFWCAACR